MRTLVATMAMTVGLCAAPAAATPIIENNRIYCWGDPFGDANADGLVDATDLALLRLDLGWSESAFGEPIPEPATMGLLALGALSLLARQRRYEA
ncbi:hypothetical protein LCGC14_0296090 [marine sediment metagenome]|uniref:Ice-binding protein C-terminal domain-containing protein n=1 Tax=marine sediment metagenome TaxID=412755 RepID=A0A0F9TWX7_9ZZZZ|nr:PEP-CTERM sorting domain-containing protein [Phycisphaerae bacterium]HDZ44196.1 PEP-CTERM sorting domain-containing protein [Phycisphaerae bacterium]